MDDNERGEIAGNHFDAESRGHAFQSARVLERRSLTLINNLRLVVMWILDSTGDFLEGEIFDRNGSIGC